MVEDRIVKLQQELKSIKSSQVLDGDNSVVYRLSFTKSGTVADYDDGYGLVIRTVFWDGDGGPDWRAGGVYSGGADINALLVATTPFPRYCLENVEVWINNQKLEWLEDPAIISPSSYGGKSFYFTNTTNGILLGVGGWTSDEYDPAIDIDALYKAELPMTFQELGSVPLGTRIQYKMTLRANTTGVFDRGNLWYGFY